MDEVTQHAVHFFLQPTMILRGAPAKAPSRYQRQLRIVMLAMRLAASVAREVRTTSASDRSGDIAARSGQPPSLRTADRLLDFIVTPRPRRLPVPLGNFFLPGPRGTGTTT